MNSSIFQNTTRKILIDFWPGRFYRLGTCDLFWLFSRGLYSGECITYLVWITFQGRNLSYIFGGILENRWFHKYILTSSDLYKMHMPSLYIHILVCFYHQEGTPFLKYLLMHWKKWIFLVPKQIITKIHKNLYLPASFEAVYAMFICIFFSEFQIFESNFDTYKLAVIGCFVFSSG